MLVVATLGVLCPHGPTTAPPPRACLAPQVALALLAVWVAASFVRASTRRRPWPSKSSAAMANGHAALTAAARGGGTNGTSSGAVSSP